MDLHNYVLPNNFLAPKAVNTIWLKKSWVLEFILCNSQFLNMQGISCSLVSTSSDTKRSGHLFSQSHWLSLVEDSSARKSRPRRGLRNRPEAGLCTAGSPNRIQMRKGEASPSRESLQKAKRSSAYTLPDAACNHSRKGDPVAGRW